MSLARSLATTFAVLGASVLFAGSSIAQTDAERTAIPSKGLLWGSKMTLESQPCCTTAGKPAKPASAAETATLTKLTGHAARDGDILQLGLDGNRTLKITDCADESACEAERFRRNRLVAWWPQSRIYVVEVSLYEGSEAYLVEAKNGRTTRVAAPPALSPSGRKAVALQSNLMAGVILQSIDLSAEPPKVADIDEMPTCKGFGPDSFLRPKPVWADDSHVRFEGVSPQPGDNPNNKQLLKLGAGKPAWEC